MTIRQLVLAALLSGSACMDVHDPVEAEPTLSDEAQLVRFAHADVEAADVCDVLPAHGPCSHACDQATLTSFVPPGTCAVFHCALLDGREVSVHACRPD